MSHRFIKGGNPNEMTREHMGGRKTCDLDVICMILTPAVEEVKTSTVIHWNRLRLLKE